MAGKNRTKSQQKTITAVVTILILALISIFSAFGLFNANNWKAVYSKAGLSEAKTSIDEAAFSVHYIDVGQGDSELIKSKGGNILIDAGDTDHGETVAADLKKYNIKSLDYLITTHPHSDHIGGIPKAIENITVKNVIMPKLTEENTPTTKTYEDFLEAVANSKANVIEAKVGSQYTVGDVKFTVLSPAEQSSDLNNMSVVIKLEYKNTSFMFMGDAGYAAEDIMLKNGYDLTADVLKVGHHGSSYSTGKEFLTAVDPSLAVMSCGLNNIYGHPADKTINKLEKAGIEYKRTDKNGTVVVISDGDKISVSTEK